MRISHGIPHPNKPVALTIGNFDGVHLGHQAMLKRLVEAAHARGLDSCVLTFEPHPREFFAAHSAPPRLASLREKLEQFHRLGVDRAHVCRFNRALSQLSAQDFIERILVRGLAIRWLLVGDDFRFGAGRAGDLAMLQAAAAEYGFEVVAMPSVVLDGHRISSTAVRQALAEGDLDFARSLLGRPYSMSGRVVHGDKLGKQLGFPTANIRVRHNKPLLKGIFAVELCDPETGVLRGVASLGVRPTVKQNGEPTLEVHLFDFTGDLYGRHVEVLFLKKLRDEAKFPSLDALTRQIAADVANAKKIFLTAEDAPGAKGNS